MSLEDEFPFAGYRKSAAYGRGPRQDRKFNGSPGGPPCPTCGSRNSIVVDSRSFEGGQRRRRKCQDSEKCVRWSTYETNVDPELLKAPDLSTLDKNRILRASETLEALKKSLNLKD